MLWVQGAGGTFSPERRPTHAERDARTQYYTKNAQKCRKKSPTPCTSTLLACHFGLSALLGFPSTTTLPNHISVFLYREDIKCVSLPVTIKHPHHHLLSLFSIDTTKELTYSRRLCRACGLDTYIEVCYRCDVIFHSRCCLLPPQIINRRYDMTSAARGLNTVHVDISVVPTIATSSCVTMVITTEMFCRPLTAEEKKIYSSHPSYTVNILLSLQISPIYQLLYIYFHILLIMYLVVCI